MIGRGWLRFSKKKRHGPGRWWKIDALTLGLGLAFAWLTWRRFPDSSSFFDAMMPNFASELIGVWLGVRIIDYLIANQEEYHRVRRNILNVVESSMELSRKILIKYDVVFLEEFQSRRALAERIYEKKQKWFAEDELDDFARWIEQGVVFEVAGRRYFQQVSDLKSMEVALPSALSEHFDWTTQDTPAPRSFDRAATAIPAAHLLNEAWFPRITNALNEFIHNPGRPIISDAVTIPCLCREAKKRLATTPPAVRQVLERWFDEIDVLMALRDEFDAAFKRFNHVSEALTMNILEETEE